jgi:hypothetical protein
MSSTMSILGLDRNQGIAADLALEREAADHRPRPMTGTREWTAGGMRGGAPDLQEKFREPP